MLGVCEFRCDIFDILQELLQMPHLIKNFSQLGTISDFFNMFLNFI
jgi:hypothetical protein